MFTPAVHQLLLLVGDALVAGGSESTMFTFTEAPRVR